MRRKADPLMLLAVLVVSGVILSHFVVFSQANKPSVQYSKVASMLNQEPKLTDMVERFNSPMLTQKNRQLVRIDPLRQQSH